MAPSSGWFSHRFSECLLTLGFLLPQFSDTELLGAVIFQPGFLRRFLSKRNMNFLSPFDRQLVWVELLLSQRVERKPRTWQCPVQGEPGIRCPWNMKKQATWHMQEPGKLSSRWGGRWGGDRQQSMSLRSHSPHNLLTDHLRIWESRPVAHTVWESSFFCLVSPESPVQKALDAGFRRMLERAQVLVNVAPASPFTRESLGPLLKSAKRPHF